MTGSYYEEYYKDKVTFDVPSLEGRAKWLEGPRDYIKQKVLTELSSISETIKDNGVAFGTFAKGTEAAGLHDGYLKTVGQGYANIADQLDQAAAATRKVLEQYRTAEERNSATAQNLESIFSEQAKNSSSGSSSPSGTTPTMYNSGEGL